MNFFRKLIPGFLKEWDLFLLRSQPRLWSTRVHYHLWFLLLVNALIFLLGMALEVTDRSSPDPEAMFGYMILPAVIYLALWIYRVVRFNLEKRNGIRKPYSEVGEFMVHWVSLLLIVSIPYTLAMTVAFRTAHLNSDNAFRAEVDLLNAQAPWFYGKRVITADGDGYDDAIDYTDYRYDADVDQVYENARGRQPQGCGTHQFFRNLDEYAKRTNADERASQVIEQADLHDIYMAYIHKANQALNTNDTDDYDLDTAAYYNAKADSIETDFPLLFTRHGLYTPDQWPVPVDNDSLLEVAYVRDIRAGQAMDPEAIRSALAIAHKYRESVIELTPEQVLSEFNKREKSSTGMYGCEPRMGRISEAKGLHYFFTREEFMFYFLVITSFVIALLVAMFKNIYWQPFLLLFVTAALLPIVIVIFAMLTEHGVFDVRDDVISMYCWWLVGVFTIGSLFFITSLKAYRTTRAVMLMVANLALPFFALFTLMILHDRFDIFGQDALQSVISDIRSVDPNDPRLFSLDIQASELREKIDRFMACFLWAGMALYVFVLHPVIRSLYTRMMALPERK